MAKAAAKNTEETWTINDAFRHLVDKAGLPSQVALRQMTEKIQRTRLPVWVNGQLAPRPEWMAVELIDGEAMIVSTASGLGWDPKAYVFSVAADDVRRLWSGKTQQDRKPKAKHKEILVIKLFTEGALRGKYKPAMTAGRAHGLVQQHLDVSEDTVDRALKTMRAK